MVNSLIDTKEVRIWNVKFNLLTAKEIADIVNIWLDDGKKGIHLTGVDISVSIQAQDDALLNRAIMESDLVNIDSYLPAKMLAKNGYDIKDRVPTPDVMEELFKKADEKEQKVFLFGAKESTVKLMVDVLTKEYPKMKIVGYRNGYYNAAEEEEIAEHISSLSPDYLFIGMPTPRKEHFILKYKGNINVGVFLGVGGAFDAKAGVLKRPPKWLRGHGGEALFRIIRDPKVYGPRISYYFKFFKIVREENRKRKI